MVSLEERQHPHKAFIFLSSIIAPNIIRTLEFKEVENMSERHFFKGRVVMEAFQLYIDYTILNLSSKQGHTDYKKEQVVWVWFNI